MPSEPVAAGVRPVALVTGAARRIGRAVVTALHAAGHDVAIHFHHSRADAEGLASALEGERSGSTLLVDANLLDTATPQHLVDATLTRFGRLDALVNNASTFYPTDLGKVSLREWDDLMGTNLRAPFFLSQAAAPHLEKVHGAIVNIVDIHGERPLARHTVYSAAKAGLIMVTRSLAKELAPAVRVNGVAPGAILWAEHEEEPETQAEILERTALGRPGSPEDIAGGVLYLLRDAPYVTGHVLTIDGGRSLNL